MMGWCLACHFSTTASVRDDEYCRSDPQRREPNISSVIPAGEPARTIRVESPLAAIVVGVPVCSLAQSVFVDRGIRSRCHQLRHPEVGFSQALAVVIQSFLTIAKEVEREEAEYMGEKEAGRMESYNRERRGLLPLCL